MKKITLQDRDGKVIPYDPATHRDQVLAQIAEADIWPDYAEMQAKALDILTFHADMDVDEFSLRGSNKAVVWAMMQLAPINLAQLASSRLDDMIADGRIQFTTQTELDASIVPESDMTEADTRHPKNKERREARALEVEVLAEFGPDARIKK